MKHITKTSCGCGNFIGIFDNYEMALSQKPSVGDTYSVYEMKKVASIKSDIVFKITKVGGKVK